MVAPLVVIPPRSDQVLQLFLQSKIPLTLSLVIFQSSHPGLAACWKLRRRLQRALFLNQAIVSLSARRSLLRLP